MVVGAGETIIPFLNRALPLSLALPLVSFSAGMGSTILKLLRDAELVRVGGAAPFLSSGFDALKGKTLLLYFSASWCPPCRRFTPVLKEFYEAVATKHPVEVVWVSSDDSQMEWGEYGKIMAAYYAVPFENRDLRTRLKQEVGVCASKEQASVGIQERKRGIPTLAVVKPDGTLLTIEGDEEITRSGIAVLHKWDL